MNITQNKIDEVTIELVIDVVEDDYSLKVDQVLKEQQRKTDIRGFRPGKVPFSLVQKMYGKSVVADEVNKLVYEKIYKYLEQNNIEILAQPIPNTQKADLMNIGDQKNFTLYYEMGLNPQFDIPALENIEVDYYSIMVTDEDVDKYIIDICKRYGTQTHPETASGNDIILAEFTELDVQGQLKEGGINHKSSIAIDLIKSETGKQKLLGLKKDETLDLNLVETFEDAKEISRILSISEEKVAALEHPFRVNVTDITHVEPSELNQELYQKVFQYETINSEEEFRERIKADALASYNDESDRRFINDVVDYLLDNTNVQLPDEFLKRFLLETSKKKTTPEQIEASYKGQAAGLKYELIENRIFKENNVSVTEEDVKEYYRNYYKNVLSPNENGEYPEERINSFVNKMMERKEDTSRLMEKISENRLKEIFKSRIKMKMIETTYTDFIKSYTQHVHHDHDHDLDHDHHDHEHHEHDEHDHEH